MSTKRILGMGGLVMVVALVTVVAVGVWSLMDYGRKCDSWFGEGLLGPENQRQRVETPHGFTISMAGDWTAEVPPPDPDGEERLGMRRAPVPSLGCGLTNVAPGVMPTQAMMVDGVERGWRAFVPQAHDGLDPVPLWLQLHGKNGGSSTEVGLLKSAAETHGFVVVAPDANPAIRDGCGRRRTTRWT